MTPQEEQLYGDLDTLIIYAGGYLIALEEHFKDKANKKMLIQVQKTINDINKRYRPKIDEMMDSLKCENPDKLSLKNPWQINGGIVNYHHYEIILFILQRSFGYMVCSCHTSRLHHKPQIMVCLFLDTIHQFLNR